MDVMNSVLRTIEKSRAFQFSENSESRIFESIRQLESRIRIPNYHKAMIVVRAGVKNQLRLI